MVNRPICRSCGADRPLPVFSLGEQPLANALAPDRHTSLTLPRYPLEVCQCHRCGLAQLTVAVSPDVLFTDYPYFSSYSPTVTASAQELVSRLIAERGLGPADLVVEVASNDGYLLQHYLAARVPVLGVDPAHNVVASARARGIPTRRAFFDQRLAEELRGSGHRAAVVHANNVLAHVPDPNTVLSGIARLLADEGVAVLEFPYLRDLVEGLEFDTIYHEHLCYFSVTALKPLFNRNGLSLFDAERIPLHGGSLRVFAGLAGQVRPRPSVERLLAEEQQLGLADPDYFRRFAVRVDTVLEQLRLLLAGLSRRGRVAAYGAAAKGTVLLNALGPAGGAVEFVADHSPHKQGLWVPGVGVPIVSPQAMLDRRPDYVLLLAWNFADEILERFAPFQLAGGRFVVPVPQPRIVEPI